jgi:hypothetical protein
LLQTSMKKQMSYLTDENTSFKNHFIYKEYTLACISKWQFALRIPEVKKQLKKITCCTNKPLSRSNIPEYPHLLASIEVDRITFTTAALNHTHLELKIYR